MTHQTSSTSNVLAYSIQHLTFGYQSSFSSASQATAIQDLTHSIHAGEILGVLGPNGSGKTTLLKLLGRILRAHHGQVTLFGQDFQRLSQADIARVVALVPQDTQEVFPFTMMEVVMMGRYPHHSGFVGWHWENSTDRDIVTETMDALHIDHLGTRLMTDVSGGERQRAIIARALAQQPQVLLLDEPTAFLDLHHQLDIFRILRRLNQDQGLTVVMVTHDLNSASQYCDRLLLLEEGHLVKTGRPEEVIRKDVLEPVYECPIIIDQHPQTGSPRVSLPA